MAAERTARKRTGSASPQDGDVKPHNSPDGGERDTHVVTDLRLGVSGIHFTGDHGVEPDERHRGNRFVVDLEILSSRSEAVASDDLEDTLDYREITHLVRQTSHRQRFHLIESLAGAIAEAMLSRFPQAVDVRVRVAKLAPPGLEDVDRTTAEVTVKRR